MRPKLFTPRNFILALVAMLIAVAWFVWQQSGGKIAFIDEVPSTAGKLAFVRNGDIYMTDGTTGQNTVALTNDKKGVDGEPAWAADGETVALTSDRNGIVRQLYVMNPVPGATVAVRTNSSTTKEVPQWTAEGDIYFLDGGKIARLTPKTADIDSIFPTAEQKRKAVAKLFASGGISRFAASADGAILFAAVKQEQGEALVAYIPQQDTVAAFGIGEKVLFQIAPDGSVIAVICGGVPFSQAIGLLTPQILKAMAADPEFALPNLPDYNKTDENIIIKIDNQFAISTISPVPFAPNGLALSSDGTRAVISSSDKKIPGVFLIPVDGSSEGGPLANLPASEPSFSPDNSKIAFVSGNDIFVTDTTINAGNKPVNLTNGQGASTNPVWSPAKPKK